MTKSVKKRKSPKTKRKYNTRKPTKKLNRKQLKQKRESNKRKKSKQQSKTTKKTTKRKNKKGGFRKCSDCDLSNSFRNYMDELKSSLDFDLKGGGYSVSPDNSVGNLPVINQYDDNNPPVLVNKKLINSKC